MRLLDTDVLIDIQRGHAPAVEWFSALSELPAVPGFVVMELVQDAKEHSAGPKGTEAGRTTAGRLANGNRLQSGLVGLFRVSSQAWIGIIGFIDRRMCHWPVRNIVHIQRKALSSCSWSGDGAAVLTLICARFRNPCLLLSTYLRRPSPCSSASTPALPSPATAGKSCA